MTYPVRFDGQVDIVGAVNTGSATVSGRINVQSIAGGVSDGCRVFRADGSYVLINVDDGGASSGLIQAGNNSSYQPLKLNPIAGQVQIGPGGLSVAGGGATVVGNATVSGRVLVGDGTAALPSVSFSGKPNSGLYYDGAFISFADSGIATMQFALDDFRILSRARGTGNLAGAQITIGRNTSGNGAPGTINLVTRLGANAILWIDSTGLYRGDTFAPTEVGGDTGGTVLGTQTSQRSTKDILATMAEIDARYSLGLIRSTPIYQFRYKNGAYNDQVFVGITTDDSPEFGMDNGKSFNPISAFGHTALALQELIRRVEALEAAQ